MLKPAIHSPLQPKARAFTVMELLVCLAVVALLTLLLLVGVGTLRRQGEGARCIANLRQIGAATALYLQENRGFLPVALEKNLVSGASAWEGENFGAWYWQMAPYLHLERWTTVRKYLGPQGKHLYAPIVLTCPSHGADEPMPITYPSIRPVSYAPSTRLSAPEVTMADALHEVRRLNVSDITSLSGKIWLSDSTQPGILNISAKRWARDAAERDAWPRISFNRHGGAGNALFFDGHVERIPYSRIVDGNLASQLDHLFDPQK